MSDRFDVEQGILSCWTIIEDIQLLTENVMDGKMDNDGISNYLIGLKTIYGLKFDKCFNNFEEVQQAQLQERRALINQLEELSKKSRKSKG